MKLKPLIISVLVIAILAFVGWKLTRPAQRAVDPGSLVGEKLLPADILEKAEEIVFEKPAENEKVVLKREKGGDWALPEYYGLRADFNKLKTLSDNLLDASITRLVTRNPERMERLELGTNRVTLKSNDGNSLWELETGKRGSNSGLFIRLDGREEAYLADLSLYLDTKSKNWADKKLLNFEQKDVSRLRLEFSGKEDLPLEISRTGPDAPFALSGPVEGETLKQDEVKSLISTLLSARFNDVRSPGEEDAEGARRNSRQIVLELFNGDVYTLSIGRRPPEPVVAGVEVEVEIEAEGEEEKEEEPEPEPGPVFIFFEISDAENYLNRVMSEAALVYSEYTFNQIPQSRDKLVEAIETGTEEEGAAKAEPSTDSG